MMRARLFSALVLCALACAGCGKKKSQPRPSPFLDAALPMPASGEFELSLRVIRVLGEQGQTQSVTQIEIVDDQLSFSERWEGAPHAFARPPASRRRKLTPAQLEHVQRQLAESGLLMARPDVVDAGTTATFVVDLRVKTKAGEQAASVAGNKDDSRPEMRAASLLFSQLWGLGNGADYYRE